MENLKKFRIKFRMIMEDSKEIQKEILIDNCMSSLHSQVRLEDYLKRKYIGFKQLIVESCKEETTFGDFFGDLLNNRKGSYGSSGYNSDLDSIFGNLFGKSKK